MLINMLTQILYSHSHTDIAHVHIYTHVHVHFIYNACVHVIVHKIFGLFVQLHKHYIVVITHTVYTM